MTVLLGLLVYILVIALMALIAFAITARFRRARMQRGQVRVPHGYVQTDEIFIDPTTGARQRVWYNERTGDRWYETLSQDWKNE